MTEKNEGVFDYIKEANLTASPSFHGELIPESYFTDCLEECVVALNKLDVIKKALFYGKPSNIPKPENGLSLAFLPGCLGVDSESQAVAIIHAVVGKATEGCELLEALLLACGGEPFDTVNAIEEVGDGLWYDALLLKALNSTFDEAQRTNIRKLRLRYPNAFTEYDAMNRDLFGERKILESKKD